MLKVEVCAFSGLKIYPGHGKRVCRADGKTQIFLSGKCERNHALKRNPRKINWTVLYRRKHRKGMVEETSKERTRFAPPRRRRKRKRRRRRRKLIRSRKLPRPRSPRRRRPKRPRSRPPEENAKTGRPVDTPADRRTGTPAHLCGAGKHFVERASFQFDSIR